jgi:PPM family protein phosphatase
VSASLYREISLTHMQSGQKSPLPLGMPMTVPHPSNDPNRMVGIRFILFNPQQPAGDILIERVGGNGEILVDNAPVMTHAPIRTGSLLAMNGVQYRVELQSPISLPPSPLVRSNWLTMTGSVRDHNEDAIGIYIPTNANTTPQFYIVCDGVGGAEAGEFVSEFAIKRMLTMFHQNKDKRDVDWLTAMNSALVAVNTEVRRFSAMVSEKQNKNVMMGSTMVAAVIQGWEALILHVGDSRLYHYSMGSFRQITTDHSTTMAQAAEMQFGQTMYIPTQGTMTLKKNVLMRGIGKGDSIEPDLMRLRLQPGDKILMCSDGMSDKIPDPEIGGVITGMEIAQAPDYLARTADTRMCRDNISVILLEFAAAGAPASAPPEQERAFMGYNSKWSSAMSAPGLSGGSTGSKKGLWIGIGVAIAVILAVIVAVFALSGAGNNGDPNAIMTSTAGAAQTQNALAATEEVTQDPTETPLPSETPTPVPTDTPTPLPPTATLRRAPTATLRP